MSRLHSTSTMFQELEEILNASATILFLNGLDYPKNDSIKMIDYNVLQEKVKNHIIDEYKDNGEVNLVVFYDCGNQFEGTCVDWVFACQDCVAAWYDDGVEEEDEG